MGLLEGLNHQLFLKPATPGGNNSHFRAERMPQLNGGVLCQPADFLARDVNELAVVPNPKPPLFAELKAPVLIERDSFAGTRIGETDKSSEKNKTKGRNDVKFPRHGV